MTMQEGREALGLGTAEPTWPPAAAGRRDRAYFLDLLGDSHCGLGRHEAAIEAYREAAQEFEAHGARCSYALCLLKIAGSYLARQEPWHAIGYLEACLPLLRELGLVRPCGVAEHRLAACQAELAHARLLGEGRAGRRSLVAPPPQAARAARPSRPGRSEPWPPGRG